ncbi:MAG: MCE family protein [Actinomycetota bacterium]|nr:MCE family protein [Actinomycetota bacterium]
MARHTRFVRPPGRREPRRQDLARRGALVALVFAVLLGLTYVRATGGVGGDPEVSALLRNAGGSLRPGSDVKISGVIVGRVTEVTRAPEGDVRVGVRMTDDDLESIPANVVARILPATVFGTSFVDLVVYRAPSDEALEAGAVIPADTSQGTLELQQALDDIDRLVKALGPAELASAIGSTALALEGLGEKIGQIIETADAYFSRLTPRMPLLRSDLRKLAANLQLVDRIAPDLLQATEDGLVTVRTIVTQKAAVTALIAGGTALSRASTAFLSRNQQRLVQLIDNGALLMDVLYDNRRAGISGAIATNIAVGRAVPTAIREGFLRSDAHIQTVAPPFYTAGDRPSYAGAPSRNSRLSGVGLRALVGGDGR